MKNHKLLWGAMFGLMLVLLVPIAFILTHPTSYGEVVLASAIAVGDAAMLDIMWKRRGEVGL